MLSFEKDCWTKTAHSVSCDYRSHESGLGNRSASSYRSGHMRSSSSSMSWEHMEAAGAGGPDTQLLLCPCCVAAWPPLHACGIMGHFLWLVDRGKKLDLVYSSVSEKAMAPHSSTLTWKIPWMEKAGRLQSMGSLRVRHDWVTSLWLFTFVHWRRKWQPTPVFLPGESQGWGSLVGCRLWGRTESDTTEVT